MNAETPAAGAAVERLWEAAAGALKAIDDLISDSEGVYGLHRNGDPAMWSEITEGGRYEEWLLPIEGLRAALASFTKEERSGPTEAQTEALADLLRPVVEAQQREALRPGLEKAILIAERAGKEMTEKGPWDEGMRDMAVRISMRLRNAISPNGSNVDQDDDWLDEPIICDD